MFRLKTSIFFEAEGKKNPDIRRRGKKAARLSTRTRKEKKLFPDSHFTRVRKGFPLLGD